MNQKQKEQTVSKKKHRLLKWTGIILGVLAVLIAGGFLWTMNHTQLIVGAVQQLSQNTVNTKNLNHPLHDPIRGVKENGQYTITELQYDDEYPNSYLDITYPDENISIQRPTLVYFHGGGFFGGSKTNGDPLASEDSTALLDDICSEGFNLVNADYALVPDYLFPVPVIQANQVFRFLSDHADEFHLDLNNIVIMGSSAGAVIASQLGTVISNPEYASLLRIQPVLRPEQVKALVIDDAPLDYQNFSLGTKILVGNYVKGSVFLNQDEIKKYNSILWQNENSIPSVLLASEYHVDLRKLHAALDEAGAENILIDPLAEENKEMPHCFVAGERNDPIAKDAYNRMIAFIQQKTKNS